MYSIGQLAKRFSISRSSLIYYDKINLLTPSARSEAKYRLYSQQDFDRLAQIILYKDAGLSLEDIAQILDKSSNQSEILEQRLSSLNAEISSLRKQQKLVVDLLGKDSLIRESKIMNKEQWVSILEASGMSEKDMHQWHIEFEKDLPEVHTDFLESLGIEENEIKRIKAWSKEK